MGILLLFPIFLVFVLIPLGILGLFVLVWTSRPDEELAQPVGGKFKVSRRSQLPKIQVHARGSHLLPSHVEPRVTAEGILYPIPPAIDSDLEVCEENSLLALDVTALDPDGRPCRCHTHHTVEQPAHDDTAAVRIVD